MVVNLVAINKDDYVKNFTFICKDRNRELAPAILLSPFLSIFC